MNKEIIKNNLFNIELELTNSNSNNVFKLNLVPTVLLSVLSASLIQKCAKYNKRNGDV